MHNQATITHSAGGSHMKVVLEFILPEEQQKFMETFKAQEAFTTLRDIEDMLRTHRKKGGDLDIDEIGFLISKTLTQVEA